MAIKKNQKSALLDSSVWISYHLQQDIFHFDALKLVGKLMKQNYIIYIPVIVFYEVTNVLFRKTNSLELIKTFHSFLKKHQNKFQLIEFLIDQLYPNFESNLSKASLKTMDYLIFCYYTKLETDILTSYDEKLSIAGKNFNNLNLKK